MTPQLRRAHPLSRLARVRKVSRVIALGRGGMAPGFALCVHSKRSDGQPVNRQESERMSPNRMGDQA